MYTTKQVSEGRKLGGVALRLHEVHYAAARCFRRSPLVESAFPCEMLGKGGVRGHKIREKRRHASHNTWSEAYKSISELTTRGMRKCRWKISMLPRMPRNAYSCAASCIARINRQEREDEDRRHPLLCLWSLLRALMGDVCQCKLRTSPR